jgi:hypothetical protein
MFRSVLLLVVLLTSPLFSLDDFKFNELLENDQMIDKETYIVCFISFSFSFSFFSISSHSRSHSNTPTLSLISEMNFN